MPPGGYAWWYVDVVSDDGRHGLTLIFFVGSVFSPHWRRARQEGGDTADPFAHCAVNACLYGPGGRWAFTERAADPASPERTPDSWTLGDSRIGWRDGALEVVLDEVCTPWPRRLKGRVRLWPELTTPAPLALHPNGRHRWWPVAPRARAEVELTTPDLCFSGQGYHDANWGEEPLEAGFRRWTWSRAWTAEGALLVYDTEPRQGPPARLALRQSPDGRVRAAHLPHAVALPGTFWGVGRDIRAEVEGGATLLRTFEDTPFYNRSLLRLDLGGEQVLAVHEAVDLDRFSAPWVQRLLPFRIRRVAG